MNHGFSLEKLGLDEDFINEITPRVLTLLLASSCKKIIENKGLSNDTQKLLVSANSGLEALIYNQKTSFTEQVALHKFTTTGAINDIVVNLTHHLVIILRGLCESLTNDDLYTIATILRIGDYGVELYEILSKYGIEVFTFKGSKSKDVMDNNFIILSINGTIYIEGEDELINVDSFSSNNDSYYLGIVNIYGHDTFVEFNKNGAYNIFPIIDIDMSKVGEGNYRVIQESDNNYHLVDLKNKEIFKIGYVNAIISDNGDMRLLLDHQREYVIDFVKGEFSGVKKVNGLSTVRDEVLPLSVLN